MAEEIVESFLWSDSAKASFNNIIEYLKKAWTDKEIDKFINETEAFLSMLKRYPEMCRPSQKRKHVRVGILNKHTQIIYHYKPRKKQIEVLLFWGFKQNPGKFKY
jgi:plasmid stabilization system protein ParE